MAALAGQECPMCHEVIADPTLHFRKCKGADLPTNSDEKEPDSHTATARVRFTWTSTSGFTYRNVTLLSAFQQSIELLLTQQGDTHNVYWSEDVDVPIGEYDGQLVIGSSYLYPIKKFLIEQDGDIVPLEFDLSKLEHQQNLDDEVVSPNGNYDQYASAYATGSPGGDPDTHYNPAYTGGYDPAHGYNERGTARYLMIFAPTEDNITYKCSNPNHRHGMPKLMPISPPERREDHSTTHDPMAEEFSQQLSEEGFTPATVKSKKGSSNSAITKTYPAYSSITASTPLTHTCPHHTSHANQRTTPTVTTTTSHTSDVERRSTSTAGNKPKSERFSVSQFKEEGVSTGSHVTKEQYDSVCEEKEKLNQDHSRVQAQLEGQVRSLRKKLSKYEGETETEEVVEPGGVEELVGEVDYLKHEMERKDKEIAEDKDRITALENQIEEYAGTIDDQNRVIHNYTHHGGGDRNFAKIKELNENLQDYSRKQQLELRLKLNDTEKKLKELIKWEEENIILRDTCQKLTTEVSEYRTQTKMMLKDIEMKERDIATLSEQLQRIGTEKMGRGSSQFDALELETMRQKCDGWRESAEKSVEESEVLRIQVQQLEQERDSLNQELQGLAQRLQSSLSDKESGQSKVSDLHKKIRDLQDMRIHMEQEMSTLRAEKTNLTERNAALVKSCDPNEIDKVKQELEQILEEKELFEEELKNIQIILESHQKKNLDLKQQLERTSNPENLEKIQEKLKRYRQERDGYRKQVGVVKEEMEARVREEKMKWESTVEQLISKKRKYREQCKIYERRNFELVQEIKEKNKTIAFLQDIHGNGQEYSDVGVEGLIDSDDEMGVANTPQFSANLGHLSSAYSLPIELEPRKKVSSGIVLTSRAPSSTHKNSYTSVVKSVPVEMMATPTSRRPEGLPPSSPPGQYIPSLNVDDYIFPVQLRTKRGLKEAYVQKLDRDALKDGTRIVVQRKNGSYEEGVVKYIGYPVTDSNEMLIGIHLDLERTDGKGDGRYKDNQKYFDCPMGHGLFVVSLQKLFVKIDVD